MLAQTTPTYMPLAFTQAWANLWIFLEKIVFLSFYGNANSRNFVCFFQTFFFHISVFLAVFPISLLVSILRANSLSGLSTSRLLAVLFGPKMENPTAVKTKQSPFISIAQELLILFWHLSIATYIKHESPLISSQF